jgi:hypothetical protein
MTEKKKAKKKTTVIPKKPLPRPVPVTGGGQGGFMTGMGNGMSLG